MSIKKYHKSANLFDVQGFTYTGEQAQQRILLWEGTLPEGTYTVSIMQESELTSSVRNTLIVNVNGVTRYESSLENYHNNAGLHAMTFDVNEGNAVSISYWTHTLSNPCSYSNVMLNSGSTPLPYEPYDPEVWHSVPYRKYGTETDAITTLPTTVIGDGTPVSSYTIKGNTEQSGTPTPENPIIPSGCGEKTENLFDIKKVKQSDLLLVNGTTITKSTTSFNYDIFSNSAGASAKIPPSCIVLETGTYTLSFETIEGQDNMFLIAACPYTSETMSVETQYADGYNGRTFVISEKSYVTLRIRGNGPQSVKNLMINLGSTAPTSYIPYGYKLPITLGSTTTNIYLGEVQSTRRIKKLVLTGEESWKVYQTSYYITVDNYYRAYDVGSHLSACSHYPNAQTNNLPEKHYGLGGLIDGETNTQWNGNIVLNPSPMISSRTDWISYLAAQYAAGTPVTIWYVLAEPETAVVNEPLMKISDYVDSVSGANLATSGTAQELNIETTLKPSELDLTYHGWHEHKDTKFTT